MNQFVAFHLGGEQYALPIGEIQEVIRYTEPRTLASGEPWVIGVISLRGKILPVGDLAARLGIAATPTDESKMVIIDTGSRTAGVIVDAVDEVLSLDGAQLDTSTTATDAIVRGIAKLDRRLLVVLDPDQLHSGLPDTGQTG